MGWFADSNRWYGPNEYVTVSVDTSTDDVCVLWLRSSTAYYNKYSGSWGGVTDTGWAEGNNPTNLTSNYSGNGMIFAAWTSGSGSPYSVKWDYVVIPENLWFFLGVVPLIPVLIKRQKDKKNLKNS